MQVVVKDELYGDITYNESNMTGKKTLAIGGVELQKTDAKTFKYVNGEKTETATLKGNYLLGVKLLIGGREIVLTPAIKWYEYVLAVFSFAFLIAWSNIPRLVMIVPIVGGAIGGGIYGLFAVLSIFFMKKVDKIWLKLLIWLAFFAVMIGAGYLLAIIILSAMH